MQQSHSEFEWIEQNNRRQFEFIKKYIIEDSKHGKYGRSSNFNVTTLKGKDLLIANFDIAIVGKSRRRTLISTIKHLWNKTIESDKLFSWYKKDLERKLDVTWGWLCKYEKEAIKGILPPSSAEDAKIIFDRLCQDHAGKELRLLKIKRRLSQVKYHQSRKITKEPLYLEIDKDIKKALIEAAESSNKSMTEIVEYLIETYITPQMPPPCPTNINVISEKFDL